MRHRLDRNDGGGGGEITEVLCAVGKAQRGKEDGTFLAWCFSCKPSDASRSATRKR
jgi:hypothetical protein